MWLRASGGVDAVRRLGKATCAASFSTQHNCRYLLMLLLLLLWAGGLGDLDETEQSCLSVTVYLHREELQGGAGVASILSPLRASGCTAANKATTYASG